MQSQQQLTNSTNNKRNEANLESIRNTEFIFIVAPPGTGKTFTGDYLAVEHGFHHVDGDFPGRNAHLPQYKVTVENLVKSIPYIFNDEDGPEELWKPYFDELARLTLEAASSGSEKVVLSHATCRRRMQDHLISRLVEAGAEKVTILCLTIDEDTKLKGLYYRTQRQLPPGTTIGDFLRASGVWSGEGEISLDDYIEVMKGPKTSIPFQYHSDGIFVDVTKRGELSTLDRIDRALKLGKRKHENATCEEIEEMIKPIDIARDRDMVKNNVEILPSNNKEPCLSSEESHHRNSFVAVDVS